MHAGIPEPPPPEQTPPGPGTPPPGAEHAGRYGQRAGGTHPTGMQSCLSNFRKNPMNRSAKGLDPPTIMKGNVQNFQASFASMVDYINKYLKC